MAKHGKRWNKIYENVKRGEVYPLDDALKLLKENSTVKFVESVDVAIRLGIDPRKSDQGVRGSSILPHGTGKTVRVAVFAQGENVDKAKEAGADIVGFEDLADEIKGGMMDFDVVIATPDAMRVVGKLGQVLGPRGLMPNPKVGTVSADVATAVKNAKGGQLRFRADKGGIIHGSIGNVNFDIDQLAGNLRALVADLIKAKPSTAKGQYLQKIAVSTTMGAGITVENGSVS